MKKLTIFLIDLYKILNPLRILAPATVCRYETSCSTYTKEMIQSFGVIKGVKLGLGRFILCR